MIIRKEIKEDNTFGGNYPYGIDYTTLPINYIEITEEQRDYIDSNLDKLRYDDTQDGLFETPKGIIDISNTIEYQNQLLQAEKQIKKQQLFLEVESLDKKRIRAFCEPAYKEEGLTWLEYYTSQIQQKRQEIIDLD